MDKNRKKYQSYVNFAKLYYKLGVSEHPAGETWLDDLFEEKKNNGTKNKNSYTSRKNIIRL